MLMLPELVVYLGFPIRRNIKWNSRDCHCGASNYDIGWVLFKTDPGGTRKPIVLWTRSLLTSEKIYSSLDLECLAVIWVLTAQRLNLMCETFVSPTSASKANIRNAPKHK